MGVVTMIAQLVLSLSILVVLHELGHFLPAKWFKTRVEKFYLFFDPWFSLVKKKIGETEYGIGWLPLGGYVKISGMIDESMDKEQMKQPPQPWEFRSKPAWQRLIIMLGGVTVNFILGFFIFAMILFMYGEEYLPTANVADGIGVDSIAYDMGLRDGDKIVKIGDVDFDRFEPSALSKAIVLGQAKTVTLDREGRRQTLDIDPKFQKELSKSRNAKTALFTPRLPFVIDEVNRKEAKEAGLEPGDRVTSINGIPTPYYHVYQLTVRALKGQQVTIGYDRDGQQMTTEIQLTEKGQIGVAPVAPFDFFATERQDYSFFESIPAGINDGWTFLTDQFQAFGEMFRGNLNPNETLGGFGTITKLFPETWQWESFWYVTAVLSLILGFMNLLPIPALDGGHVMFLIYEVISGRKPSDKFMEYATLVGFALVLGLVIYANGLDIWRGITGN